MKVPVPHIPADFYSAVGFHVSFHKHNIPQGLQYFEKALALAESSGDTHQQCKTLNFLSTIYQATGAYHATQTYARRAQRLANLSGYLYEESNAVNCEAMCCIQFGDYKRATVLLQRGKHLMKLCDMSVGTSDYFNMSNEAEMHLFKSEYTEARSIYALIVQATSGQQDPIFHVWSLLSLAEIDATTQAPKEYVEQTLNTAKPLFQALDFPQGVTSCEMISADLHLREGDLVVAKDLIQKCLTLHWEKWSNASGVSYCLERLADVSRWSPGDVEWSFRWAVLYLAHSHKLQQRLFLHTALRLLSEIFLIKSDQKTAHSLLILALEGFTQMDVHRGRAQCMLRLGDIAAHQGDLTQAIQFWKDSQPLFERSLQTRLLAAVDRRLLAVTHGKALGDYQAWIFGEIAPE